MPVRSVLAIGAHPHDVEYYAGATLAALARKGVHVTVVVGTDGECGGGAARDLSRTRRLESERAYRIAIKRWGKRGRLFLDALRQGNDVLNASSAAGVTRQTGHKYLSELKKLLSEKNLSK